MLVQYTLSIFLQNINCITIQTAENKVLQFVHSLFIKKYPFIGIHKTIHKIIQIQPQI